MLNRAGTGVVSKEQVARMDGKGVRWKTELWSECRKFFGRFQRELKRWRGAHLYGCRAVVIIKKRVAFCTSRERLKHGVLNLRSPVLLEVRR